MDRIVLKQKTSLTNTAQRHTHARSRRYLENPPTVAEACLMNGYTIVSQRVLEQIMEENRRLERRVRELENIEILF